MDQTKPTIIFRADGNSQMGLGHMIRSTALASALKEFYNCILVTRCNIPKILSEASTIFDQVVQLSEMSFSEEINFLSNKFSSKALVVLDGYSFDSAYQQHLLKKDFEFFSIDDIHNTDFFSRAVINHSGGLRPQDYKAQPYTQFYLGPYYSLLRQPFLVAAQKRNTAISNKNCLVCFGGADPANKTLEVLKRSSVQNYFQHFHVVTGSAYQFQNELVQFAATKKNISLYSALEAEKLCELMKSCSFCICSPSTVAYEYMSVGGVVFLEQIADNQQDVIKYMVEEGLAFPLAGINVVREEEYKQSLLKQSQYFDGKSGERFRKIIRQYFDSRKMFVRRAEEKDLQVCFEWANDPDVRAQSYNQNTIHLIEHTQWFLQKLKDRSCFFYIMEMDSRPVAQIRFQVNNDEAVLGYLADKSIRQKGLGTYILAKGIEKFVNDYKKSVIITGLVKEANMASQRSFEKLAFVKESSKEKPGSFKYTMHCGYQN